IEPTRLPAADNLNELFRFGTTVTIEDSAIGQLVAPELRNGWPNAYIRPPSRWVTVPAASIVKSPRTSCTLTDDPGPSVFSFAGTIGPRLDPPPTPAIG